MRRLALTLGVAAALVLGVGTAVTSASEPFVSGSGEVANGTKFNGTGHGTPLSAKGNFWIEYNTRYKIDVDCVNIQGNRAALEGNFVDGPGPNNAARGAVFIEDNGNGPNSPPDRVFSAEVFARQGREPDCGFYRWSILAGEPVTKGNFVINDG